MEWCYTGSLCVNSGGFHQHYIQYVKVEAEEECTTQLKAMSIQVHVGWVFGISSTENLNSE